MRCEKSYVQTCGGYGLVIGLAVLLVLAITADLGAQVFFPGGRFATAGTPAGVVQGDFNGDGDLDLAVSQRDEDTIYVHLNDGAGGFATIFKLEAARDGGLAAGDFDNDGYDDLALYDEGWLDDDWGLTVYMNNGDQTFTRVLLDTVGSPWFATGDFDGDSYCDIVVYNYFQDNPGLWMYHNRGDGSFEDALMIEPAATDGPQVGDIDGDGDLDLLYPVLNGSFCRLNEGNGTFADPISTLVTGLLGQLTELNGDGFPDLLRKQTYGCSGYAQYLIGNGDGTFAAPLTAWITAGLLHGIWLAVGDYSYDGYPDIALWGPEYNFIEVGYNDGRLRFDKFRDSVSVAGGLMFAEDLDGDGDCDLAAISGDDTLRVLFSRGAQHDRTHMVPDDYATIQEAVDAAWNLDTIIVCPGDHIGTIDFGGKNLVLISSDCAGASRVMGNTDPIVRALGCVLDGGGAGSVLTFNDYEDDRSVVSGFTIRNGNAAGYGGGIYCYEDASPTITDNIFIDNYSGSAGGGLFVHTGSTYVARNYFISNSAGNWGGGIYTCGGIFVNNTVYGNSAGQTGGGLYYNYGTAVITTNIFWNNDATSGNPEIGWLTTAPEIAYSVVNGGYAGTGNISDDPLFVDAAGGDFGLLPSSPCINAGDPGLPLDPDGSLPDMGAYYYENPVGVDEDPDEALPFRYELSQNYPNPFNPLTAIRYSLPRRGHVRIDLFNVLGRRLRTLVDGVRPAGVHSVVWDGKDDYGRPVGTGVYLYRFESGDYVETKKMLLLK